jgi:hypothetical protein
LQIKIDVDVHELMQKLMDANLTATLVGSDIMERLAKLPLGERSRAFCRTAVIGGAVGTALSGAAMGTMRAMAEVERYEAQTGRPYPVCGPHRVWDGMTITGRYASVPSVGVEEVHQAERTIDENIRRAALLLLCDRQELLQACLAHAERNPITLYELSVEVLRAATEERPLPFEAPQRRSFERCGTTS